MLEFAAAYSGVLLSAVIFSVGMYLLIRFGVSHLRPSEVLRRALSCGKGSAASVTTALGGTVGAGNIIGVAGAVRIGGAGAVLWLIVGAFLGMAIKFCEVTLSVKKRIRRHDGSYIGGAMYASRSRPLAVCFCIALIVCAFFMGNVTQCRCIFSALPKADDIGMIIPGVLTLAVATVVFGRKSYVTVGRVSSVLVPIMGALYLGAALVTVLANADNIPNATVRIFSSAFRQRGERFSEMLLPMTVGISRGLLSNEAGLGSSPIAHAASHTDKSEDLPYLGVVEVFFSSVVVGLLTSYALLVTDIDMSAPVESLTGAAFGSVLGAFGRGTVRMSTALFAFTSVIGWYFYADTAVGFLSEDRFIHFAFKAAFCLCVPLSLAVSAETALRISDIVCFLMCIFNVLILIRERKYCF